MRILATLILIAATAGAVTYDIDVSSDDAGYFLVTYYWAVDSNGDGLISNYGAWGTGETHKATFKVQSLSKILPSPSAMRAAGEEEDK